MQNQNIEFKNPTGDVMRAYSDKDGQIILFKEKRIKDGNLHGIQMETIFSEDKTKRIIKEIDYNDGAFVGQETAVFDEEDLSLLERKNVYNNPDFDGLKGYTMIVSYDHKRGSNVVLLDSRKKADLEKTLVLKQKIAQIKFEDNLKMLGGALETETPEDRYRKQVFAAIARCDLS